MSSKKTEPSFSFPRPDQPSRCTWAPDADPADNPHTRKYPNPPNQYTLYPSILHTIGNTPLVRLNVIPKEEGVQCQMYAKCEFLNPSGSLKDRAAWRMIEDAEATGVLKPGYTIVEPSSGNTGIGLALAAAVKGYKMVVVMPLKMSKEKVYTMKALGARIIRTPNDKSFDHPQGMIAGAHRIASQMKNAVVLDQFRNPNNPLSHYETTGEEILRDTGGKVDMIVLGCGTGGGATGIGRKIKEKCPSCKLVGADPWGSILAQPQSLNDVPENQISANEVEGIGYSFCATTCDRSVIDQWGKCGDKEAFLMARRLIKSEGLLVGGSSGTAMHIACQAAKSLRPDQVCVVILPDGIRNYLTKFASDEWMVEKGFLEESGDLEELIQ
uniref:cystathionine beta-synthase n=2 Tax=Cacopsylla melanoneura TaxID=428564 RepID=A0A8D8XXY9_9HEMI